MEIFFFLTHPCYICFQGHNMGSWKNIHAYCQTSIVLKAKPLRTISQRAMIMPASKRDLKPVCFIYFITLCQISSFSIACDTFPIGKRKLAALTWVTQFWLAEKVYWARVYVCFLTSLWLSRPVYQWHCGHCANIAEECPNLDYGWLLPPLP